MIIYNVCELRENTVFIFFKFICTSIGFQNNPKNISLQIQGSAMDVICSGFAYWPPRY